ncbi:hypothetical protein CLOM_g13039 [Closterium sp. NIES-68]|nr:hypothetical protein CLOM_g13039 [Closterium sp. NIES-68]GJP78538.1 hypothetical protein CLOP_g8829 [Closterium sp. NIES-67]GJP84490.1 hypothetical protein CLOP_g14553 [Closterium sp. NIES-67]
MASSTSLCCRSALFPGSVVGRTDSVPLTESVTSRPFPSLSCEGLRSSLHGTFPSVKAAPIERQKTTKARAANARAAAAIAAGGGETGSSVELEQISSEGKQPVRPVVILPGLGNNSADYAELVALLETQGVAVEVARVARPDWLRNAAGLLQADYWKGTLKPRPILDWYLERVAAAVAAAKKRVPGCSQVSLVAHSAGGWLARLYLAEYGHADVALLLSLGSPHLPPPPGAQGVVDQTRGLLTHMQAVSPGAFHAPHVKYVCVSGRYIKGLPLFGGPSAAPAAAAPASLASVASAAAGGEARVFALDVEPVGVAANVIISDLESGTESEDGSSSASDSAAGQKVSSGGGVFQARMVGQGYKQVCGQAEVWGDGVVPEDAALLEGAENLILDGVYHSPVGASEARPWYGSPSILPKWQHHLLV